MDAATGASAGRGRLLVPSPGGAVKAIKVSSGEMHYREEREGRAKIGFRSILRAPFAIFAVIACSPIEIILRPILQTRASPIVGTACVALAAMGWGTWSLFVRGRGLPAAWESVMILVVIGAASLPGALLSASRSPRRPARAWLRMGALRIVDAGNYVCYFAAIERAVGVGVLTHYLAPVLVAALAPIYLREPPGRRTPLALGGAVAGLVLLG